MATLSVLRSHWTAMIARSSDDVLLIILNEGSTMSRQKYFLSKSCAPILLFSLGSHCISEQGPNKQKESNVSAKHQYDEDCLRRVVCATLEVLRGVANARLATPSVR
jgi:hypothetical protein